MRKRAQRGRRRAARRTSQQQAFPESTGSGALGIFRGATALTEADGIYGREEDLRQLLAMVIRPGSVLARSG